MTKPGFISKQKGLNPVKSNKAFVPDLNKSGTVLPLSKSRRIKKEKHSDEKI